MNASSDIQIGNMFEALNKEVKAQKNIEGQSKFNDTPGSKESNKVHVDMVHNQKEKLDNVMMENKEEINKSRYDSPVKRKTNRIKTANWVIE